MQIICHVSDEVPGPTGKLTPAGLGEVAFGMVVDADGGYAATNKEGFGVAEDADWELEAWAEPRVPPAAGEAVKAFRSGALLLPLPTELLKPAMEPCLSLAIVDVEFEGG